MSVMMWLIKSLTVGDSLGFMKRILLLTFLEKYCSKSAGFSMQASLINLLT